MKASNYIFFILITAGMLINLPAFSQKKDANVWPNFRGSNCSGIASPDQDPPITFDTKNNVLWKITIPGGHSSPCIWNDRIFISGYKEEEKLLIMLAQYILIQAPIYSLNLNN